MIKMLAQSLIKPPEVQFYALSQPMIGHVIPGVRRDFPVTVRNFDDLGEQVRHKKAVNPVIKFPSMHDDHTKGHPMVKKLLKLLGKHTDINDPEMREGYQRMTEDLSWRNQNHLANTHS